MFKTIRPCNFKKPKRKVNRVFIHCSASDADNMSYYGPNLAKTIHRWHRQRGWSGIGYHYVIDKMGNIVTGRDIEKTPAAQARHNRGTIAICLHGLHIDRFKPKQLSALYELCSKINDEYNRNITFHGHREVSPKTCPVIDYKELLRLDEKGYMQ